MSDEPFLATVHAGSTTLSPSRREVVGFDLEGRPIHWFRAGETYKRSLASEVFGRRRERGTRRRWRVPSEDTERLFARALAVAREAQASLADIVVTGSGGELARRVERVLEWTPESLAAERERFLRVYQPVSILPPDQYQSVVLQASFGCSWNRCTFCTFYQDRPFRMRRIDEFEAHVAGVKGLLGAAAEARESVFLADGNALVLANSKLRPVFEVARSAFPGRPINAFVDVFSGEKKGLEQWRELRELGLGRVAIGVETGNDELLGWLNKPGSADEAAEFVACLKEAGLSVSVIVMVGAGGRRFAEAHLADSLALLERLPLDAEDLVYLSPFVLQPGSAYETRAAEGGVEPLDEDEAAAQYAAFRAGARSRVGAAKVALYHIDEFVY
ncbi:MAG TPA: radical SAM protein [Trueperaceae bacterium]|nr:radical SAM protein [Trueperaceae bacterium]